MPHVDPRSGELVIRIVYDGAPEAGKTTNVHQLAQQIGLQRRGAATSPGTTGARTQFFDWLDFSGGFVDGRRVRCQLVSVPGQSQLLHRRQYLLETADVVVFVADSRRAAIAEATRSFATTVGIVERLGGAAPIGLVLQANKQDLPDALAPAELGALFGDHPVPIVGSDAATGAGVMETFILAVRLATERVRALLVGDALPDTPDSLHAALRALDRPAPLALPPLPPTIALPDAFALADAHVWPPVLGRAAIVVATAGMVTPSSTPRAWAPRDAIERTSDRGWLLHTTPRWRFATEAEARAHLRSVVRGLLARPTTTPEGRAAVIARDADAWRTWLVTRDRPTVAEALRTDPTLDARVREARAALDEIGVSTDVPAGLEGLVLHEGRLGILALDE